jgi:hypothetical protein
MACPFFLPDSPLKDFSDLYQGGCAMQSGGTIPSDLLESCNRGYARQTCARAAQSDSDAFRFLVKSHTDGMVHIAWSSERNHHPVAVGVLTIDESFSSQSPLEQQAKLVYFEYLRHIGQ